MSQINQNEEWSPSWKKFFADSNSPSIQKYKKLFSISEIEKSNVLQWFFGAMLIAVFITFSKWIGSLDYTKETALRGGHVCWQYFQNCEKLYFLSNLPDGYSLTILYTLFFGMIILSVLFIAQKNWAKAHMMLLIFFVWHLLVIFVFTREFSANYLYFATVFLFIFLILPFKAFFLRLVLVLFYFLSGSIKIHNGWILGTYFTSLATGLPVFPDALTPLFTNGVIFMEIIGVWFLLSKNKLLQRISLTYFIMFHLYSIILVQFMFPTTILPALLILFGPLNKVRKVPLEKKAFVGWIFIASLILIQFISVIIPGDEKITMEGNFYGVYMFEANHQCVSAANAYDQNGSQIKKFYLESILANKRCDPYARFFEYNKFCKKNEGATINWTFDHSINGEPFLRIVDVENVCDLEYKPFSHNEWVILPENAEEVGNPVKNVYLRHARPLFLGNQTEYPQGTRILNGLEGSSLPKLNAFQKFLVPTVTRFKILYWVAWSLILTYVIVRYILFPFITKKKPVK